ncbi:MAG: biotin/lipoyl-containing protein, partial [Candidatus Sericytochromatia bacterium]
PQRSGYRCDTGIASGSQVSVFYDALLAKLIAHGPSRDLALARMQRFLKETRIFGLKTNLQFLGSILQNPRLQAGDLSTTLIRDMGWEIPVTDPVVSLAALIAYNHRQRSSGPLKAIRAGFRNLPYRWAQARLEINGSLQELEYNYDRTAKLQCTIEGCSYDVFAIECSHDHVSFEVNQSYFRFEMAWQQEGQDEQLWLHHPELGNFNAQSIALLRPPQTVQNENAYISQMPGKILKILVQVNEPVKLNQTLLVIESMKMETQIAAHADGIVTGLYVSEGQLIESDTLCIELK